MTQYYRISSSVIHERFDEETVIVKLDVGRYYSLGGSAEAIWALAASAISRTQIVLTASEGFSGDPDEIARETIRFLDELVAEQLLESIDADAPSSADPPAVRREPFITPHLQKYTDMEELLLLDPIHQVDELGWPSARKPVS